MWNKLPDGMKNLNSLGSFKYSLKGALINNYENLILTYGQP